MGKHTPLVHFLPSHSARKIEHGGEGVVDRSDGTTTAAAGALTSSSLSSVPRAPSSSSRRRPPSSSHPTAGPNRMAAGSPSSLSSLSKVGSPNSNSETTVTRTNIVAMSMPRTLTTTSGIEVQRSPTDWSKSSGSVSTAWSSSSSSNGNGNSNSAYGGGDSSLKGGNITNVGDTKEGTVVPHDTSATSINNDSNVDNTESSTPKRISNSQQLVSKLVAKWNKMHPKDVPKEDKEEEEQEDEDNTGSHNNDGPAGASQPPQVTVFLRKSVEELEVTPKEGDAERFLLGINNPKTTTMMADNLETTTDEKPVEHDDDGDGDGECDSTPDFAVKDSTKCISIQDGMNDIELSRSDPSLVHALFLQKEAPPPPRAASNRSKRKKAILMVVPKASILKKKVARRTSAAVFPTNTHNADTPSVTNSSAKELILTEQAAIEVSRQATMVISVARPKKQSLSSSKNIEIDSTLGDSIELSREQTSMEKPEVGTPAVAAISCIDEVVAVPSGAILLANAVPAVGMSNDGKQESIEVMPEQQSEVKTASATSRSFKKAFKVWSKMILPGRHRARKSRDSVPAVNIQPEDCGGLVEVNEGTLFEVAPKMTVPAAATLTTKDQLVVSSIGVSQEADGVLQIADDTIEVARQPSAKITAIGDTGNVYHETIDAKATEVNTNDGPKIQSLPQSLGTKTPSPSFRIVGSTSPVSSFDNHDKAVAKKEGAVSVLKKTVAAVSANQTNEVSVTRAQSVRTTASSPTVVQKTSGRTYTAATKPFVHPASMKEADASSLSLSPDTIGSRTRVRTAKLKAIRPSPKDTPFIRPQQLLVTDDNTDNIIEIMRHPSPVVPTTIQEVTNDSTARSVGTAIAKDDPVVVNLPAEMATSLDELDAFLSQKEEYTVHVNVLGVAGIVVDRSVCNGVKLDERQAPFAPSRMKAVVGISMHGGNVVEDVTTFSEGLILSPSDRKATLVSANDDTQEAFELHSQQRLVAVWAVDKKTKGIGSSISTVLSELQKADTSSPFSHYLPVAMDLTIALSEVDESSSKRHVAIPIGVAHLVLSSEAIRHGDMVSLDVPVVPLESSEGSVIPFIEVESKGHSKLGRGIKQLFKRHPLDLSLTPTNEEHDSLRCTYRIDIKGDSMVRIEFRVEKTRAEMKKSAFRKSRSNKSLTLGGDLKIHLSSSVETEETTFGSTGGSLLSGNTSKSSTAADLMSIQQMASFGTLDSKTLEALMYQQDQHEPLSDRDKAAKRYSSPLVFQQDIAKDNDDVVSVKNNMSNPPGSTLPDEFNNNFFTCSVCGPLTSPMSPVTIPEAALRLDDRIEEVADKMFGANFPFMARSYTASEISSKKTEEDEAPTTNDSPLHQAVQVDSRTLSSMFKTGRVFEGNSVAPQKEHEDDDSLTQQSYSVLSEHGVEGSNDSPSRTDTDQSTRNFSGHLNDAQEDVKQLISETTEAVKDYVTDKFGKWAVEKAESFFPTANPVTKKAAALLDETASMGDATLEAFVNGQLRMRSMGDASKTSAASTGEPTYSTAVSNPTYASPMPTAEGSKADGSRTGPPTTEEDEEDTMGPVESRPESVPGQKAQMIQPVVETQVKMPSSFEAAPLVRLVKEGSASFDATPTVDTPFSHTQDTTRTTRTFDETLDRTVSTTNGERTRNEDTYDGAEADDEEEAESQSDDTGSPHSVVEAIAEAISQYTSCGGAVNASMSEKRTSNATRSSATTTTTTPQLRHSVPRTVNPLAADDLQSVGELTATTLEKKLEHAARQAQAARNKFFSTSRFSCGNLAVVDEDDVGVTITNNNRNYSSMIRLQTPMDLAPSSTYSTLGVSVMDDDQEEDGDRATLVRPLTNTVIASYGGPTCVPENYFAEYEDVGLPRPHSRVQYLEMERKRLDDQEEDAVNHVVVDDVAASTTTTTTAAILSEAANTIHVPVDQFNVNRSATLSDPQLSGEEC